MFLTVMLTSSERQRLDIYIPYNRCCLKMLNILILGIYQYFNNEPQNGLPSEEKSTGRLKPPYY